MSSSTTNKIKLLFLSILLTVIAFFVSPYSLGVLNNQFSDGEIVRALFLWLIVLFLLLTALVIFLDLFGNKSGNLISKWIKISAFTFIFTGFVFALEILCGVANTGVKADIGKRNCQLDVSSPQYFVRDNLLGYKPNPATQIFCESKYKGEVSLSTTYTHDEYGRRLIPDSLSINANRFLLFVGGSYTYGDAINDDQTFPYLIQEKLDNYQAYNYGFSGYGTQNMLALLESDRLENEIKEETGILVYTFLPQHVERVIGSMRVVNSWGPNMPYYTYCEDSTICRKGNFTTGRPMLSRIYRLLGASNIFKLFKISLPLKPNKYGIKLTFDLINRAKEKFLESYPGSKFVVMLYPYWTTGKYANCEADIVALLHAHGMETFDYRELFDMSDTKYNLMPANAHPNAQANEKLSDNFVSSIQELEDW